MLTVIEAAMFAAILASVTFLLLILVGTTYDAADTRTENRLFLAACVTGAVLVLLLSYVAHRICC